MVVDCERGWTEFKVDGKAVRGGGVQVVCRMIHIVALGCHT